MDEARRVFMHPGNMECRPCPTEWNERDQRLVVATTKSLVYNRDTPAFHVISLDLGAWSSRRGVKVDRV